MRLYLLVVYLQFRGMLRKARYGLQFLLLPLMTISIFLTAYFTVRALGGTIHELFFPFLVFVLSASAINVPMQGGNQLFSEPTTAHLWITPRGILALLTYFLGVQTIYFSTLLLSLVIAYFLVQPQCYFLNSFLGFCLLVLWCIGLICVGFGFGIRFLFAFHLAQLIFLGFYFFILILPLTGRLVFSFVIPPVGIISVFKNEGNVFQHFFITLAGILVYNFLGFLFVKWSYKEYRIGNGVNRV